uniref:Uncharacterized protein n=1 Tax=Anguilla anguilla TaxID=7936 RepID=A0A0E9V0W0_ANGAN
MSYQYLFHYQRCKKGRALSKISLFPMIRCIDGDAVFQDMAFFSRR